MEESKTYFALGRRKTSIAKVWLTPTKDGKFNVNKKSVKDYLCREDLSLRAERPLVLLGLKGQFDVKARCVGGGNSGQADALALAISRALIIFNPDFKPELKSKGLLTRDPREVERKKYGRPKARKRFQFSKR